MKKYLVFFCYLISFPAMLISQKHSIRFYGSGFNDSDRIKIPLVNGNSSLNNNVAFDFTIEFWLKANGGSNPLGTQAVSGANDDWTLGHIIVDRDIFGQGNFGDYGISLANGRVAFGVNNGSSSYTIIGTGDLRDGGWHHIAVTRKNTSGELRIFIDGTSNASAIGPIGNCSYNPSRSLSMSCPAQGGTCINEPYIILGAEKHDYDPNVYPSYNGWMEELRISNNVRYSGNFLVPTQEFTADANTVGLFHFNEGIGTNISDVAGISNGLLIPHSNPANSSWSSDSPFQVLSNDHIIWDYELSGVNIYFFTFPELVADEEILIERFDFISNEFKSIENQTVFKGQRNNLWQIGYAQDLLPEGLYRLSRISANGQILVGEIKQIQFHYQELNFFPNPVTELLTISSNQSLTSLSILNSFGNLIYTLTPSQVLQRCALDFSNYPRGVYFIKVEKKDKLQPTVLTVLKE